MIALTEINRYPLKSGAAARAVTAAVTLEGLTADRGMMVVDATGICLTARKAPPLLAVRAVFDGDTIVLQAPGMPPLALEFSALQPMPAEVEIWGERIRALDGGDAAAAWLSGYLGQPARLAVKGNLTARPLRLVGSGTVNLADTAPLLLTQWESLDEFNSHLDQPVEMARFRPNLVIEGGEAFAEDGWKRLRIGDVEFIVAGACDRCVMTTLDPVSGIGRTDREPLTTLARYRRAADGNVFFGAFLVPVQPGRLHVGDKVTVLETGERKVFLPATLPPRVVRHARPVPGITPPGPLSLRCVGVVDETHDARCFRFQPVSGSAWPYRAGQFMTLSLPLATGAVKRSYTISSAPSRNGLLEITVKRVPGGIGSNWLHDHLEMGATLEVSGPSGRFCLDGNPGERVLMLAAGSGITPMLSMLRSLVDRGADTAAHLHVSAKTQADLIADRELRWLADRSGGLVTLSHNLTRETAADGTPPQRLSLAMLDRACPDWRQRQIYCCGPDEYRRHVRALLESEVPRTQYHEESFGAHGEAAPAQSYQVTFQRSGKEVAATDSRTLLEIARSAGIAIASNCEAGICGTCRCQKLSGALLTGEADMEFSVLDTAERAAGYVLACSVRPSGAVVIDL